MNDKRKAKVANVLLRLVCMEAGFESEALVPRPSDDLLDKLDRIKAGFSLLSPGQDVMVQLVFDLWNGSGQAKVSRLLAHLTPFAVEAAAEALALNVQPDELGTRFNQWFQRWSQYDPGVEFFRDFSA